jgi:hypothetical protein
MNFVYHKPRCRINKSTAEEDRFERGNVFGQHVGFPNALRDTVFAESNAP